ncbi:glutamate-5-semialdehyde dehydrogenase [Marinilabiliaceae bacterium JC017]|nr:glutamate-5-semialdehyde dehydrogenase [Marinilabiliaceae bacterium JC017]
MKYIEQFKAAKKASRGLNKLSPDKIAAVLILVAEALNARTDIILEANKKDLSRMSEEDPRYDRLMLTPERIEGIASDTRQVAELPSPLGQIIEAKTLPNRLEMEKRRTPLGVVGVIYEARPNVTVDVFALCVKSGNVCVLKGGHDADESNKILVSIIKNVLKEAGIDTEIIQLLGPDRTAADELMQAQGYVDVLIPRGSQNLINSVRAQSKIPVIETGAGIVHTYFDKSGDIAKGANIIFNAKTRRVSVCNALDCLILHKDRLCDLPKLVEKLAEKKVVIMADEKAFDALSGRYPAELLNPAGQTDFGTEFLSFKMAIKTVASFDEAIEHIYEYSSQHSEAIVAEDQATIDRFFMEVDAAAVYANASTAFTDGAQFGMGAEIGISTQKLHARGPMALNELTSYKWIIKGNGQTRPV